MTNAAAISEEMPGTAPHGFALGHYLREAWRIITWDDDAIRRVMDDGRALRYGAAFWIVSNAIPLLIFNYFGPTKGHAPLFGKLGLQLTAGLVSGAVFGMTQLGMVHLVAIFFCAGDGKFIQVLRPLSLASIIFMLEAVPAIAGLALGGISWATLTLIGYVIGSIAWVAVMVMVFDVVDSMDQLTAFVSSIGAVFGLNMLVEYLMKIIL